MAKIIVNSFRTTVNRFQRDIAVSLSPNLTDNTKSLSRNAKLLAWAIFLMFFIEGGTLGILPKNFYFVYRNMRISDFILYGLIIYSFFKVKEYEKLFNSRSLFVIKILLLYLFLEFVGSAIIYNYNIIELFFRLKFIWTSFLVFPFLLLLRRNALQYLIKIMFPVVIVSNFLYILCSLTGIAFLPDVSIVKQTLPGGFKIYRVYGGTFYGDVYFLGFIYFWITKKFKPRQLVVFLLFVLPHILSFGRGSWLFYLFTIGVLFIWNSLKNKNLKTVIKQIAVFATFLFVLIFVFTKFIPQANYLTEAIESRIEQGKEDYKYKEGTYGSRLVNTKALVELWSNNNHLLGIGMHPLWVLEPLTEQEYIYYWGFCDIKWAGVLAAYGLIGFLLFIIFEIYYGILAFKILKHTKTKDIYVFFAILLLSSEIYASFSYNILNIGLFGPSIIVSFYVAAAVYKYENP